MWTVVFSIWNTTVFSVWAVLPFILAGTARWVSGWLHLAVVVIGIAGESRYVSRRNPNLKMRRKTIGAGTARWDLVWNLIFWPLMASIAITGGLQYKQIGNAFPYISGCVVGEHGGVEIVLRENAMVVLSFCF